MRTQHHPLISELMAATGGPCLSLYLTTHRTQPERRDDPTRYRALVRQLATSLERSYPPAVIDELLRPFRAIEHDEDFWNARREGIALFAAPGVHIAQHLDRPVPELAVVANSFHLKPLLRILQTMERYHVLTLTKERIALFVGDRDGLSPVELHPDVPATLEAALGAHETHRETTIASSGGVERMHGHRTAAEDHELDTERFFRAVDRAIEHHYSAKDGLPIILAGLSDQLSMFQRIRKNPNVLLEGVSVHPGAISVADLTERSWKLMKPYVDASMKQQVDAYHAAAAHGKGLSVPQDVAVAAVEGRVETLFVESGRILPGIVDASTGTITFDSNDETDVDDILDDVAEIVLRAKGRVLVLDAEHMPAGTGLAAILRY